MRIFKIGLTITCLFMTGVLLSQEKMTIAFSYDENGRMIQKKIQVFQLGRFRSPYQPSDTVVEQKLDFKIYPNPTNDYLFIEGELPAGVKEAQINISNVSGQTLKSDVYTGQQKRVLVSDLVQGIYVLEMVYSKKEKNTYKIIVN
jgi:hypothetical protein